MHRLALFMLLAARVFATMPNMMVWEVRPGAGADANSGAFATLTNNSTTCTGGTDWTQQNSAQVTFNGSTVTAVTAGATATITITGYTVLTTDVCNTLRIAGGTNFTTGLYQIVSVSTGANTWTLDRNVATGVGVAMTGRMGGAMATLSAAWSDIGTGAQFNCTVWYKSGTDTVTSGLTIPAQYGLINHGYQTTRGDNTGTRPLLTTATNSVNLITAGVSTNTTAATFININFSNTAGTQGVGFYAPAGGVGRPLALINCQLKGFSYGVFGNNNTNFYWGSLYLFQTEVLNSVNDGVNNAGSNYIIGSYIHGNGAFGVNNVNPAQSSALVIDSSVIASNTLSGVNGASGNAPWTFVSRNSVYYANTNDGILMTAGGTPQAGWLLVNNIFDGNGGYGIDNKAALTLTFNTSVFNRFNNAFFNNTTGATLSLPTESSDITLSANPFVSAGSNFALNSTAGGGAALKAAGFPGSLPAGVGTGFLDVGALQSQCSASGSGACAFVQ